MYLSEFLINLERRGGRELVSSPQRIHAAVLGCFPPGQSVGDTRTLWRLDRGEHAPRLIISSPIPPDFQGLTEAAGWNTGTGSRTVDYRRFLDNLVPDQVWRFRLTANPIVSVRDPLKPGSRGKRLAHVTVAQQLNWLTTRADRIGVSFDAADDGVDRVQLTSRRTLEFKKNGSSGRVTIATAQFDGTLRVVNSQRLRGVLTGGVGGGRAYGCGLMTLARHLG